MGSRQALSNGNEVEELTDLLRGFEQINSVVIKLELQLEDRPTGRVLAATAVASNNHAELAVRARWVLACAVLPAQEYTSLAGLLTSLLYRLDFEIGEEEMKSIGQKRA